MTDSTVRRTPLRGRAGAILALAIAIEVTASLSLSAAQTTPVFFVVVVVGYTTSLALLGLVLAAGMPVGVAYGIWGACGVLLTAVFAHFLFGDPLTPIMFAGIILIIIGVLCVELGLQRARAAAAVSEASNQQ